jgi:hypothetical protein
VPGVALGWAERASSARILMFYRFDAVYTVHFKCSQKSIKHDYPRIRAWFRDVYQLHPAVASTVDLCVTLAIPPHPFLWHGFCSVAIPTGVQSTHPRPLLPLTHQAQPLWHCPYRLPGRLDLAARA